jgi:hypothetical protein
MSRGASSGCHGYRQEADLRIRRLLAAAFFFEAGLVLLILPWSAFWNRNLLLEWSPALYDLTRSGYIRGAVSGLGIVNLWVGIVEVFEAWLPGYDETATAVLPLDEVPRRGA